uniref:Uncharacterized protein n=1 Tax=Anguilla anguilla TaxID=7936 RepID=A0A0E9UIV5_ANGAN
MVLPRAFRLRSVYYHKKCLSS